eukprot:3311184-Pyramimonas_sp.AAC.1
MRLDTTGAPFESREALAHGLLQHFAAAEKASICTVEELVVAYNAQQKVFTSVGTRELSSLHSLDSLRCDLLRAARKKAGGPDLLTNDVYLAAPDVCARMLLPLLAKVQLTCREPLAWKGGVAHDLFKKGDPRMLSNFREILLGVHVCKHHHKFLRRKIVEVASALLDIDQHGGRAGRGTASASLQVRVFQDFAHSKGCSTVLYFTDLKAAFHT